MTRRFRALLIGDDGLFLVYTDGHIEPLLPGGYPRPGAAHATATTRRGGA